MNMLTPTIKKYLLDRGLSESVIKESDLDWNGSQIIIPIKNLLGHKVFCKFRKDPANTDKAYPKYVYDRGAYVELYNAHKIKNSNTIYIVEGELDALRLESAGFPAVSSTGGAGTFREEWARYFVDKEVIICYDNDDAGIKGALNVQKFIPHAKIKWLPEFKGKDVTDYLNMHSIYAFLSLDNENYLIPNDYDQELTSKNQIAKLIKEYKQLANYYLQVQRDLKLKKKSWRFTEIIINMIMKRISDLENKLKYFDVRSDVQFSDDVTKAKSVPVINYLSINNNGMVVCPFHDDSNPSMKYYPKNNDLYCWGGCGRKDVIDIVKDKFKVDFKGAIKILNEK